MARPPGPLSTPASTSAIVQAARPAFEDLRSDVGTRSDLLVRIG